MDRFSKEEDAGLTSARISELASMWTESYRLNRGLGKQEVRERKRRKGPPLLI